jgi:hypothetical protein
MPPPQQFDLPFLQSKKHAAKNENETFAKQYWGLNPYQHNVGSL